MMEKDLTNIADEIIPERDLCDAETNESENVVENESLDNSDSGDCAPEEKSDDIEDGTPGKFAFLKFGKAKAAFVDAVDKGAAKIPNVKDIHYFDDMFDFNKDGRLSMEEQAMQFDMVRDIEERNHRDSFWGSDDDSDGGEDD